MLRAIDELTFRVVIIWLLLYYSPVHVVGRERPTFHFVRCLAPPEWLVLLFTTVYESCDSNLVIYSSNVPTKKHIHLFHKFARLLSPLTFVLLCALLFFSLFVVACNNMIVVIALMQWRQFICASHRMWCYHIQYKSNKSLIFST